MDEGTSALDKHTEKRVQNSLDKEFQGKTMVSIAHRIETILNSDQIFVFDSGELKEQGKYDDLMAKKEFFYNFARGQLD
jgi:ABC-type multidrug transport system fused ATPase/permease subunit